MKTIKEGKGAVSSYVCTHMFRGMCYRETTMLQTCWLGRTINLVVVDEVRESYTLMKTIQNEACSK